MWITFPDPGYGELCSSKIKTKKKEEEKEKKFPYSNLKSWKVHVNLLLLLLLSSAEAENAGMVQSCFMIRYLRGEWSHFP